LERLGDLRRLFVVLRNAPPDARALIALIELEARFKRVVEHHDLREREYLYPLLDERLSDDERANLWRRIDAHESAGPPLEAPP
jgi:hypothetical protein